MTSKKIIALVLAVLLVFVLYNSLYTVQPKQYVAVRQFGRIVNVVDTPGLKMKVPFIQTIQRISAATILYDIPASDVITKDKKSMISDNYVLWRVTNPTLYIQTLNAIEARAAERIEAAVYNSLKKIISGMTQDEIIAARGERLTQLITDDANADIQVYGIEIIQSEIKALDLPEDNKAAVFTRMISERENIAAGYTAEGAAQAQKIRNETDRKVTVMQAEAEKQAATILAEGESEYMRILQEAYNNEAKADFYSFTRSLDALKESLTGDNKTVQQAGLPLYGISPCGSPVSGFDVWYKENFGTEAPYGAAQVYDAITTIALGAAKESAVMRDHHQSAQNISARDKVDLPCVTGIRIDKALWSYRKHQLIIFCVLEGIKKFPGLLISFLDVAVKVCHFIGVIIHAADPQIHPVKARVRKLLVKYNSPRLFERVPKRVLSFAPMFLDIEQFLLSVGIKHRPDLDKSLDKIRERRDLFCVLGDHIPADQDRVRKCIAGQVGDHTVSALKYIVV